MEKLYFESRQKAGDFLDLNETTMVLDVACGTGANFKHLKSKNSNVKIYGTDFSSGMLEKARKLSTANNWTDMTLFHTEKFNHLIICRIASDAIVRPNNAGM